MLWPGSCPEKRPVSRRMHKEKCRHRLRPASGAPVFANGATTAAMAFAFNQVASRRPPEPRGDFNLEPGELYVDVISRRLDSELGDLGFRHNALFVYTVDESGNPVILRQFSLAFGGIEFLPPDQVNHPTMVADRQAFLNSVGNPRVLGYDIQVPSNRTLNEFAADVILNADAYRANSYNAVTGPNSNTAALTPVLEAGGIINRPIPGARGQCRALSC